MASKGRAPLSELEKAKRKAARDYRKIAEMKNLSYDDIYGKRTGDKNMGRKPVSKEEQIRRAKVAFLKSLSVHRAEALKEAIELPSIRDLLKEYRVYRASDLAGRKGADRVIKLLNYIEKKAAKLDEYERNPCPMREYNGKGRKPMYKEEAIEYYNKKIADARREIEELKKDMPKSQHIYYELREARLSLRRSKARAKDSSVDFAYFDSLEILNNRVSELEAEYKEQLKKEKKEGMTTSSPSLTTTLPNLASASSNLANEVPEPSFEKPEPISTHEQVKELKAELSEVNEGIEVLTQLEEVLRKKAIFLQRKREIEQAIESKVKDLI
ncbi:hypothetical protein BM527_04545 [Alteromonas sp. Mex14]|nr:hypothetical protein BM527_04545 [Alteromonas sp. Mex14]